MPSCALLGEWADLQSVHGFCWYDDIAPNAKFQRLLVLAMPGYFFSIIDFTRTVQKSKIYVYSKHLIICKILTETTATVGGIVRDLTSPRVH